MSRKILVVCVLPLILGAQSEPGLPEQAESVLFDMPPAVETAALYTQTLQEAPANVTVITQQQIRTYGYRTLAEALSSVRGFFVTSDGTWQYAGVRGFSLPGDYNTRILVMLNGHFLTDNIYGAMSLFGQDFGIDMDLVQRIEVVRGPSSALYGSNGMFATINIFTRAPSDSARASLSTEFASFGTKKTFASTSVYLGKGANLLLAGSGFHAAGRTIAPAELNGLTTDRVGAEQGYHTFAQLTWRDWNFTANFSDRKGFAPIGLFGADFGDSGTSSRDAHNFVEATYTRAMSDRSELRWRTSYDQYRYLGRYSYTEDSVTLDNRDRALGDWVGTHLTFSRATDRFGTFTIGGSTVGDLRNAQVTEYVVPEYILERDTRQPNHSAGAFTQYEKSLGKRLVLFAGVRMDKTRLDPAFVSPKVAAVWKGSPHTSYKLMYGRSFRNPSTFERFWSPNPLLRAERMNTVEVSREQRLHERLDLITSVFHYNVGGLIEGVAIDDKTLEYRNTATSRATGFEVELSGTPAKWLETSASFSVHNAKYARMQQSLPNSPARLGQVRAAVPVLRNRLMLSTATRYMSARQTGHGSSVDPVFLADITATTNKLHPQFDLQFGVRNVADTRYLDPLSTEHLITVLPHAGRSIFLKLIWRYGE